MEVQPQTMALQPLVLLATRKWSTAPQSHPSRHILKSKKSVLHHLLGQALANESSCWNEPHCTKSEATRRGPITWPAFYPQPRHRAWFHARSGRRSARGDKGQPGSMQRNCAPGMGGHRRNPSERTQAHTPLGVICWQHLTSHIQGNLKISRPAWFAADGLCSPIPPPA